MTANVIGSGDDNGCIIAGRNWLPADKHAITAYAFAIVVATFATLILLLLTPWIGTRVGKSTGATNSLDEPARRIPFIALAEPDWKILRKSVESYRIETHHLLEQLSMALEVVIVAEDDQICSHEKKFSTQLKAKIERLSTLYDQDHATLQQLILNPFPVIFTITNGLSEEEPQICRLNCDHKLHTGKEYTWWSDPRRGPLQSEQPYDSARQVVAHMVRDWSVMEGTFVRNSMYTWCVESLKNHFPRLTLLKRRAVLVPGAGLARLAWEVATQLDYSVEAMESSISMAAAAFAILGGDNHSEILREQYNIHSTVGRIVLHPFAVDSFANEVDSSARYRTVRFPDVSPVLTKGSLSYTIGRFEYEGMLHLKDRYDAVVTCFFLDTASTVYDYLSTVAMVLSHRGIWVNLGPLQWHMNSQLPIAVDEFRTILEDYRDPTSKRMVFDVLHWSIDTHPLSYRSNGQSTRSDMYFPLRFVVQKR